MTTATTAGCGGFALTKAATAGCGGFALTRGIRRESCVSAENRLVEILRKRTYRNKTTAEYFEQKAFRISPEEQRIEFE